METDEPVQIVAYDDSWPERFDQERLLLEQTIGSWITSGVHHVGSTSVAGLAAKPVIDILVGVESLAASRVCLAPLMKLDYHYARYRSDEMHWLCKPSPSHRTHHLHLVPTGSQRYRDELAFRDALRAQPSIAHAYEELKQKLARVHRNDREAYTLAKADFVQSVLRGNQPRPRESVRRS